MDETTFRILDTLTRRLGKGPSIKALTERIEELYGSAYYVNIYKKLQQLAEERVVSMARTGNSLIVGLNFKEYVITDLLTEMELKSKQAFLREHGQLRMFLMELENYCGDLPLVRSISIINPYENAKLNRAELLFLIHPHGSEKEIEALRNMTLRLQSFHNIKIDVLMLTEAKFLDLLSSDEVNPLREMISHKIVFFNPQHFWMAIRAAAERNIPVRGGEETSPAKIPEQDLAYNLARFGYKEMGTEIPVRGKDICIEYIAIALIMNGDARRIEAVPIILAKNSVNFDILFFLSQKYRLLERMMGLLKILHEVAPKKGSREVISSMQALGIKAIPADRKSILKKMRLYNAT